MKNQEKAKRIIQAINETEHLLKKSEEKYANTIECLKMEIKENGSNKSLNKAWIEYALQDKKAVDGYKSHINKLKNMLGALE